MSHEGWLGAFDVEWSSANPIDLDLCTRCNACVTACPEGAIGLDYQIDLVRDKKAKAFFIPGNHDWNHSGRGGLQEFGQLQDAFQLAQSRSMYKSFFFERCWRIFGLIFIDGPFFFSCDVIDHS